MLLCEWTKLRKSSIWVPVFIAPLLTVLVGLAMSRMDLVTNGNHIAWLVIYQATIQVYGLLFLPMLAGILASLCCRSEHLAGGWKQLLALPVRRTTVYAAKFFYVLFFLALAQVLVLFALLVVGLILHVHAPIPWTMLSKGIIGGWLATIPLSALQLWVSTWWKSFGAPFALNIILTIPAMSIASSSIYAPLYPWAQPVLAMLPRQQGMLNVTPETMLTMTIAGVIFILGGWLHFTRRDIQA
jgi:hypothetical protein